MKLSSEELSDVVIESLVLSVALLERYETMNKNGLFVHKAKQCIKTTLVHIEEYVKKLITAKKEDEIEHFIKGATVIAELSSRVEKAVKTKNILDISTRKDYLKEFIYDCSLPEKDKELLYNKIVKSEILNY